MEVIQKLENLVKLYHENQLSHVYLIETNNMDLLINDLLETVKKIDCNQEYQKECRKCNICNLINIRALPSFIIIEPDGNNIKKEQVLDLKRRFSFKPIYTENNIYLIKNADKLNGSSANTMLKFIEEPGDNIIGFFLTTNINNVLPTIKSRCELLSCFYDDALSNLDSEYKNIALEYIKKTELEKEEKILYNKNVILDKFSERKDIELIFKEILAIYLKMFAGEETELSLNLNHQELEYRIKLLTKFLENITTNANIELLLDKYIIELSEANGKSI